MSTIEFLYLSQGEVIAAGGLDMAAAVADYRPGRHRTWREPEGGCGCRDRARAGGDAGRLW